MSLHMLYMCNNCGIVFIPNFHTFWVHHLENEKYKIKTLSLTEWQDKTKANHSSCKNGQNLPRCKCRLSKEYYREKNRHLQGHFHLIQFCPHLGYNDSPVLGFEKLSGLLDAWLITIFIWIPMKPVFGTWNNFITWKLHFYSNITLWDYSFTSFHWGLINSMRARCPLDDITRRKHFRLKG